MWNSGMFGRETWKTSKVSHKLRDILKSEKDILKS